MVARKLFVLMNNELVGYLFQNHGSSLSFEYAPEWMENPHRRPLSLSLPLLHGKFEGVTVYNFFDNLLPDNPQIRARIQAIFHATSSHPFDLLAQIGHDCVGAIQIMDELTQQPSQTTITGKILHACDIAKILRSYRTAPLGMMKENETFRISIAGAQEKTAFLFHDNQWYLPHGSTPTTHIFKLPIGYLPHQGIDLGDSCENEWLCGLIAKAFGLDVAHSEVLQFEDLKALVVTRFDRKRSQNNDVILRLPQEDLCQALGYSPNLKYQSDGGPGIIEAMQLLNGSMHSTADRDTFFRAQVINWCLGGIDAHAKNFSISLHPLGRYHLTPLYDMLSAYPFVEQNKLQYKKLKMAMAVYGKNTHYKLYGIQKRHFVETAKKAQYSIKKSQRIVDEILEKIDVVIDTVSNSLPSHFPHHVADPIFKGMRSFRSRL